MQPLAALASKQVDVLAFEDAVYAGYEAAGNRLRYIEHPVIGRTGDGGFFAMESVIRTKHAELQGFTRAIAKATVFILAGPEVALKMYWAIDSNGRPSGVERDAVKNGVTALKFVAQSWDVDRRPVKDYGAIDEKGIENSHRPAPQGG